KVSLLLKDALKGSGLESYPKVSGSKGLQLYVPLNSSVPYERTRHFSQTLAETLERRHPESVVSEMAKTRRSGKVFIDWSQNSDFKTTVAVYSLRARRDDPYISLPVSWDELRRAVRRGDAGALYFSPDEALRRMEKTGDLFEPVLRQKQKLTAEPR